MKLRFDYHYIKRIKYITLGFTILYLTYLLITHFGFVVLAVKDSIMWLSKVLAPFLWGLLLTYLMHPIVVYFERILLKIRPRNKLAKKYDHQMRVIIRGFSLILTLLLFVIIIVSTVYSVYIMINGSFKDFELDSIYGNVQNYIENLSVEMAKVDEKLVDMGISTNILGLINDFSNAIINEGQNMLAIVGQKLASIGGFVVNIIFGFVFAFNFIMNREYFNRLVENSIRLIFVKDHKRNAFKEIIEEIHLVLMNFIRGKLIDLTLLSIVTIVSLVAIGFDYAFLLGLFAGYTNIIPYLGTWIGIIPAVLIGLVTKGWEHALFVGLYIVAIQQVYYVIVSPKVQGKSIGMHPVFILLSMFIFGNLFGLIGVILSIPLGGVTKIFIVRWAKKREKQKQIKLIKIDDINSL